jgi:hypothetical protein
MNTNMFCSLFLLGTVTGMFSVFAFIRPWESFKRFLVWFAILSISAILAIIWR